MRIRSSATSSPNPTLHSSGTAFGAAQPMNRFSFKKNFVPPPPFNKKKTHLFSLPRLLRGFSLGIDVFAPPQAPSSPKTPPQIPRGHALFKTQGRENFPPTCICGKFWLRKENWPQPEKKKVKKQPPPPGPPSPPPPVAQPPPVKRNPPCLNNFFPKKKTKWSV